MKEIMAMVIVATVMTTIYKLFELFARRKERITLVEKLGESLQPDMLRGEFNLSALSTAHTFTALKLGSLLVGMGLGLLIGYLICTTTIPEYLSEVNRQGRNAADLIYGASVLTMSGLGLLVAFLVELKITGKKG